MYKAITVPTQISVTSYLSSIQDESRRRDCESVISIMERLTSCKPQIWGTSIVGFDQYHYKYASGHEGDSAIVGFSSRKNNLTIYLIGGYETPEVQVLLARLGKHKTGKGCLYIKHLFDINPVILEKLIVHSIAESRRLFPSGQSLHLATPKE